MKRTICPTGTIILLDGTNRPFTLACPFVPITYQTLPSRNAPRATILCYSCAVITDHGRTRNTSRPTGLTNVRATNAQPETKTLPTKTLMLMKSRLDNSPTRRTRWWLAAAFLIGGTLNTQVAHATTCAGATALSPASLPIVGQTMVCGATNDMTSANTTTCGSTLYKGGWEAVYTLTPTTSGSYTISYSGQTWTGIFVYAGCPTSGGTCVGNITSSGSSKSLPVTLTASTLYYIVFDTYPTPNSPCPGTFGITAPAAPLPGDNCANAQNLALLTSPYAATTVGYADDISVCRTGYPDRIFYISVPNGATLTIGELTNNYDEYEYVGYGATCPGATTIACIDNDALAQTVWLNSTGITQTVWYVQDAYSGSGTFTLQWSVVGGGPFDPCAPTTALAACGTTQTATLVGAGASWDPGSCGYSTPGQEKVYTFTPSVTGAYTLTTTATGGCYIDYMWKLASGGCSATGWTCISDIYTTGTYPVATWTAGVPVLILLDAESATSCAHTFKINCPAGPCFSAPNGEYPTGPITPVCDGSPHDVALACGYGGEYTTLNLTSGVNYIFTSSIGTDWITISDNTGTVGYAFGLGPVSYTAAATTTYRFYTHLSSACDPQSTCRYRYVQCGTPPPPPGNNDCSSPVGLMVGANGYCPGGATAGTTAGATGGAAPYPSCLVAGLTDVWYSFLSGSNTSIQFNGMTAQTLPWSWPSVSVAPPGAWASSSAAVGWA